MYLAPLNYDRYFKKVFSDLKIAKRFLEDFLDVEIQEIEQLERKKNISDDAHYVEFDFRCKIDDHYVIVEMQQWYKPDIIQRFYLYHALNTALQLEKIPEKDIVAGQSAITKIKNYRKVMPVITLVWLVDDNLGFTDDYISFVPTPNQITAFILNEKLWQNPNPQSLLTERNRLLELLENDTKNLEWLYENRLIYAFQKNIVKNKKYQKYYAWFELAQKTLDKISDKFAYTEYEKDEILREIIRRLKQEIHNPMEITYINDYEILREKLRIYEEELRADALKEGLKKGIKKAEATLLPRLKAEREKAEAEREKAEAEREKAEAEREKTIRLLRQLGLSDEVIAEKTGYALDEIQKVV